MCLLTLPNYALWQALCVCCGKDLGGWSEKEEEPDALVQQRLTSL